MKYVLCKPRGGLNDILCEVEKCWRYAEKHNRYLLIDSTDSGLHDNFWKYFDTRLPAVIKAMPKYNELNNLTCHPSAVAGELDSYISKYSSMHSNFIEEVSKRKLTFNHNAEYTEEVLVHEQCWEGEFLSIFCLDGLVFKPEVQEYIKNKIKNLGSYVGLHIRNTDYKMDYQYLFTKMKEEVKNKKIVLCSDDFKMFDEAKKWLPDNEIIRLSTFKDNDGSPLHHMHHEDQYQMNLDVLTDLIALAKSKKIYFGNVNNLQKFSGFSMLAYCLQENPTILHKLLNSNAW